MEEFLLMEGLSWNRNQERYLYNMLILYIYIVEEASHKRLNHLERSVSFPQGKEGNIALDRH